MTKNTISRKSLSAIMVYAAENGCTIWDAADALGFDSEATLKAVKDFNTAMNRPHKSKPSAETLANRENTELLIAELNARNGEFTAAEIADMTTDKDGNAMNPRKVGNLLSRAVKAGLIAKSPYKWSVSHYAKLGYEFAPKPERKSAKKSDVEESEE